VSSIAARRITSIQGRDVSYHLSGGSGNHAPAPPQTAPNDANHPVDARGEGATPSCRAMAAAPRPLACITLISSGCQAPVGVRPLDFPLRRPRILAMSSLCRSSMISRSQVPTPGRIVSTSLLVELRVSSRSPRHDKVDASFGSTADGHRRAREKVLRSGRKT
jgi:hypothetical protein